MRIKEANLAEVIAEKPAEIRKRGREKGGKYKEGEMKNLMRISILALTMLFPFVGPADALVLDLLGDKDGFGKGVPIGDGYHYTQYGAYWDDNRGPGDPPFTDYWYTGDKSWTHTYVLPVEPLVSAELEIYFAGIADYADWSADVWAAGVKVGTIPGIPEYSTPYGGSHDLTRLLAFNLTGLLTGSTSITIDVSYSGDGYIIDYSELRGITAVPEPSTLLLLGAALIGFAGFRRKFKK